MGMKRPEAEDYVAQGIPQVCQSPPDQTWQQRLTSTQFSTDIMEGTSGEIKRSLVITLESNRTDEILYSTKLTIPKKRLVS